MLKFSAKSGKRSYCFGSINGQEVVGEFSGGMISDLGGLLLVGHLEKSLGLVKWIANALVDWRCGQITYSLNRLLLQRVLLICGGYEDAIDSDFKRHDPAVLTAISIAMGRSASQLASQPTVCRFENRMNAANCYRFAKALVGFYIMTRRKIPKEITLDFDGTCSPVHGDQQGSAYRSYYDTTMYFPLLIFDQDGWLITAILRPGDQGEARAMVPALKRLVPLFRQSWPTVRIIVRADGGFNSQEIYDWCEDNDVNYLIRLKNSGGRGSGLWTHSDDYSAQAARTFGKRHGCKQYVCKNGQQVRNAVESAIKRLPKKERQDKLKRQARRHVRVFGEFFYQAGKGGNDKHGWRCERRIIAVCEHKDTGEERRFLITNINGSIPQHLYEFNYCRRGQMENYIKEMKALCCTRLSCTEFSANQARLLMHALSYLLLYKLRELLPEAQQHLSIGSVRDNFVKLAVQVKQSIRRTFFAWTEHYLWRRPFEVLAGRVTRLPTAAW